jgi:hypothetical protein
MSVAHQTAADLQDQLIEAIYANEHDKALELVQQLVRRVELETENHVRSFAEGVDWH